MKRFFFYIGYLFAIIFKPLYPLFERLKSVNMYLYTGYYATRFATFGNGSKVIPTLRMLVGANHIEIGKNCIVGKQVQLTAFDHYREDKFCPRIVLGDGSNIGDYSHVTSINSIYIGKSVLMGRNILITDNSHGGGKNFLSQLDEPVSFRPMFSKGGIMIGDNVWIGEKASIIGNVTIGKGSVIGANTVVTKDVPDYSLVVGNPMRIIYLKEK